jgi:polar amino acid transport system substrate-binding protein
MSSPVNYLLLLLFAGFLITSCCGAAGNISGTEKPVYIVGIDAYYPPFTYLDANGTPVGFDVDSVQWIADTMNFKVQITPVPWDDILTALETGEIDLIYSGFAITNERKEICDFTVPYWQVNQSVAVNNQSSVKIDDFYSGLLRVGAQNNTRGVSWVELNLIGKGKMAPTSLVRYEGMNEAFDELQAGRLDAIIGASSLIKANLDSCDCHVIGEIETDDHYGVAVKNGNSDLLETMNTGIDLLMLSPEWERLKLRYLME